MLGVAPLATLLFVAGEFGANGQLTAEVRGGSAPTQIGQAPELGYLSIFRPGATVEYREHHLDLELGYAVRLARRGSESATTRDYTAILHIGTLKLAAQPARRLRLTTDVEVSAGTADYTYLPTVLGKSQANLALVSSFLSAFANVGAQIDTSERTRLDVNLNATHHRPLGAQPIIDEQTVPLLNLGRQTGPLPTLSSVSARPELLVHLSATDDLLLSTTVLYQDITGTLRFGDATALNGDGSFLTVTPRIGWHALLAAHSDLTLRAGVSYNRPLKSERPRATTTSPVASATIDSRLLSLRDSSLRVTFSTILDYFVDPILTTSGSRAIVSGGLLLVLPSDWTVGIQGSVASTLTAHPTTSAIGDVIYPDETSAAASLPVRHRLSENFVAEFGLRWADRSPYFLAPASVTGFYQRQLWLYVELTATSRPIPHWRAE